MLKLENLRWIFLVAAAGGSVFCVFSGASVGRVAFPVVCGLLWLWMSRRKVLSIDRETLGIPPRR